MSLLATTLAVAKTAPQIGQHAPAAPSLFGAVLALLAVLALVIGLGWLLKRMPGSGFRPAEGMKLVASLSVGAKERVVVVEVNGQQLLLGVTAGGINTLHTLPEYRSRFSAVYGKANFGIDEVTDAIAAFEETLVTPNAPFDRWLKGDGKALTAQQLKGYQLFKEKGCTACHNGVAIGGNSFQKMGIVEPYKGNTTDGRSAVTGKDADRFNFKVPTLRNVALTYPYFHDGEAATLSEAVDVMGRLQLGRKFTADENAKLVAFLVTLTGDQPKFSLPELPPSSDITPRPQPFK